MMISQNNFLNVKMFYGDRLKLQTNPYYIRDVKFDIFKIVLLKVRECNNEEQDIIKDLDETRSCYTDRQKSLIKRYKKFYKWVDDNTNKDFLCIVQEDCLLSCFTSEQNELYINKHLIGLNHRYFNSNIVKFFTDFDLIPLPDNYTNKIIRILVKNYILSKTPLPLYESDYNGRNIF